MVRHLRIFVSNIHVVLIDSPQSLSTDATTLSTHQSSVNTVDSTAAPGLRINTNVNGQMSPENDDISLHGHYSCLKTALILLEALNIQNLSITRQSLAQALRLDKNALACCKRLIHCDMCSVSSSFVMLLIILCQTIAASYERIMVVLTQENRDTHSSRSKHSNEATASAAPLHNTYQGSAFPTRSLEKDQLKVAQHINLYGYDIDTEERSAVFGAIARVQLQTLQALMVQIRGQLDGSNRASHITLVDLESNKINALLEQFLKGTISLD